MKNVFNIILGLPVLSITINSCKKEELIDNIESKIENDIKKDFRDLALKISKTINQEEVKGYIFEKADQKFDGDYDILLASDFSNNDENLKGENINLKKILIKNLTKNFKNSSNNESVELSEYFDNLIKKYPTIQISTTNNVDRKNKKSSNETPLVAYVTDSDVKTIKAFDENGVEHTLTNEEIPDRPVIVISESERVVAVKKGETLSSYYQDFCPQQMQVANSEYKYFKLYNCDNGGGSGGGSNPTPTRPHGIITIT